MIVKFLVLFIVKSNKFNFSLYLIKPEKIGFIIKL